MIRRPLPFPPLLPALAVALLSLSPAGAQAVPASLQEQELAFARGLLERGWTVLAEPVIERGLAAPGSAEKARFAVLKADLLLRTARASGGAQPRAEAFQRAFAAIDGLLSGEGKLSGEGAAGAELGELLISGSSLVAEETRRETDAARAGDLRKRGLRMVDGAIEIFQKRLEAARRAAAAAPRGEEEDEDGQGGSSREEMEAAYNIARARFERALAVEEKTEREAGFRQAARELDDFQASYAETPLAYHAAILFGQCWNELGDFRRAAAAFEGAAGLTERFREPSGQVRVDNPVAAEIIQRALYLKAQAMNRLQNPAEARAAVDRALRLFPDCRKRPIGLALRIEGAQAFARQGNHKAAETELRKVVQDDPEGPGGSLAREKLGDLLGRSDSRLEGDLGPIIEGLFQRDDVPRAIRILRQALARLDPAEKRELEEKAPPILVWLGKAYTQNKRYHEAAIVFEELVERYPGHKLAAEAAFEAVKSRLLANAAAPSKLDQDRYEEDLKRLTVKYGKSPQADRARFLKADEAMESGKFEEAVKLYLEVPPSAGQFYDSANYQAGLAAWNLAARSPAAQQKARFEEAERIFQKCLSIATKEETGLDAERLQNRAKLRLAARVKLAEIHSSSALRRYPEALRVIEAIEREEAPDPEQTLLLNQSRVRTLAALGRLEDAVRAYRAVRAGDPRGRSRVLPYLCREIALAYDGQALKARKAGGPQGEKEYRSLSEKALEYYAEWLDESRRLRVAIPPATLVKTADRALAIALELTGLPDGKDSFTDLLGRADIPRAEWERAVKLLEEAKPRQRGPKGTDWLPLAKLGRAYGFLGEWAKARAALEEALVWGELLATTGEVEPTPRQAALERAPDLLDIFVDLGFAELVPAKKGGVARARAIFQKAFDSAQRDSCPWWKCRYGFIFAELKDGNYERADGILRIVQNAPEWSGSRCGLKDHFDALAKELEEKLPLSHGK